MRIDDVNDKAAKMIAQNELKAAAKQLILDEWLKDDEVVQWGIKVGFEEGAKWQKEQILQFLYSEINERRVYSAPNSASKMCEKIIEFINK